MADYRTTLQALLHAMRVHPNLDGLYVSGTYTRPGASTYDASTGDVTQTPGPSVEVRVRVETFSAEEIDNVVILHTDRKISVQQLEVPEEPQADDTITIESTVYQVVRALTESPGFTWTVQARTPAP